MFPKIWLRICIVLNIYIYGYFINILFILWSMDGFPIIFPFLLIWTIYKYMKKFDV